MTGIVYVLCAATCLLCAAMLLRGYKRTRVRLLFWSGLCFLGLMIDNIILYVDVVVVPDVDLAVWRKLPGLADPDRFDGWAYRILVNGCYAEGRRRQQRAPELQLLDGDIVTEDGVLSISDRDMLQRAFERVPPQQRAVLVLQYYLELDQQAIADVLGVPLGTVKSRAASGRQALRAALEADARPAGLGRWTA